MDTKIGSDLSLAVQLLNNGQLVGLPTETVYGLGGNALNPAAVASIFEAKNRPSFDPLIVHISDVSEVVRYASAFPEAALRLASMFWPGPLTLLLPRSVLIPDLVTSGLDRVALRVPAHHMTLQLLKALGFPLAAPSANPFGYVSPTSAQHVVDQLGGRVPYVLDGGPCAVGLESTIVGFEADAVVVYRLGGLSIETIEAEVGPVRLDLNQSGNPSAPGMLTSHYAPRKQLFLGDLEALIQRFDGRRLGILRFQQSTQTTNAVLEEILSENGDLAEAAQRLFGALRRLDAADIDLILAAPVPQTGLGMAINDRLRRAAAGH
jgi:L-threonylcarbamoyladenylate synthase